MSKETELKEEIEKIDKWLTDNYGMEDDDKWFYEQGVLKELKAELKGRTEAIQEIIEDEIKFLNKIWKCRSITKLGDYIKERLSKLNQEKEK